MADNYYKGSNNNDSSTTTMTEASRGNQLLFNLIGAQPTTVEFVIKAKDLEDMVTKIAGDALNDGNPQNNIIDAEFVVDTNNPCYSYDPETKQTAPRPTITLQVFIPARNTNIASSENNDYIRSEDAICYSDKFKQFVNTYCSDDNKTVYITRQKKNYGNIVYRGIIIDIGKFFGRIFDCSGYAYKEAFGKNTPTDYVDVSARSILNDEKHPMKATGVVGFKVRKSFHNTGNDRAMSFDVFDTRKKRHDDDDFNRDDGRRYRDSDGKDFRKDYRR